MYYIVGDIGNTSTRICLFKKSKIIKSIIFDTKNIFVKNNIKKTFKRFVKKELKKTYYFLVLFLQHLKRLKKL